MVSVETKDENAISDVAVKGDSNSVTLKGYVKVGKTHEPIQVFSFPSALSNYLEPVIWKIFSAWETDQKSN